MTQPIVIILEGIDGSGKSTLARNALNYLTNRGRSARLFRDPGGTPAGEAIRALVKSAETPMHQNTQFLLFCAARAELAAAINGYLNAGDDIVLDRWWYSTFAYQGASGIERNLIINLAQEFAEFDSAVDGLDWREIDGGRLSAYHLHVTPETSRKRLADPTRTTDVVKDRYESKPPSFLQDVYDGYIQLERLGYLSRVETEARNIVEVWHDLGARIENQINQYG